MRASLGDISRRLGLKANQLHSKELFLGRIDGNETGPFEHVPSGVEVPLFELQARQPFIFFGGERLRKFAQPGSQVVTA